MTSCQAMSRERPENWGRADLPKGLILPQHFRLFIRQWRRTRKHFANEGSLAKIYNHCCRFLNVAGWAGGERFCAKCEKPRKITLRFSTNGAIGSVNSRNQVLACLPADVGGSTIMRRSGRWWARTPTRMDLATKQPFDMALQMGRGEVELTLTAEQFSKLRSR